MSFTNYTYSIEADFKDRIRYIDDIIKSIPTTIVKAIQEIANFMLDITDKTFLWQGLRGGMEQWIPSMAATREKRRTLEDTGLLRSSFKIVSVTPEGFEIRNDIEYAAQHQHGTEGQEIRPMLFWAPDGSDLNMAINTVYQGFSDMIKELK